MKVSTEIDNNFGYEKITQLVDNIPLIIMINVVDVDCRDMFVYCAITKLLPFFYKTKCQISEKKYGQFINYDSLNKNTISLKLHNRTEK